MSTEDMRKDLLEWYPTGIVRGQFILQMPDGQVFKIHQWHERNETPKGKPYIKKSKQIRGQTSLFDRGERYEY